MCWLIILLEISKRCRKSCPSRQEHVTWWRAECKSRKNCSWWELESEYCSINRCTFNLPGANSCSKWVNKNAAREDVDLKGGENRSKVSRNLTANGLVYKCEILCKKRIKINGRLIRKYATMEDLLFSSRNIVAVDEELNQFNDIFKILLSTHEKYIGLLENEARVNDEKCFDEIKTKYFPLKRKY